MNESVPNPNVPTMGVDDVVEALFNMYYGAVTGHNSFRDLPSVMLWGPPGVGKSQGVRQIGNRISAATGKRVYVTDIRLLLYSPNDLRGLPIASADKSRAIWLRPEVLSMDPSDDVVNVLLLDEISAAPPSVQAAAYQITLDRACGEHQLPENCLVIAAGNRMSDRSTAYRMPKALANRLLHIEVEPNFASWRRWAVSAGISDKIVAYLAFRPDRLMAFDATLDDLAFASPRSWAMASNVLNGIKGDIEMVYPLICGLVGTGAASEFRAWARVYHQLPDIEGIFAGKERRVPQKADALYALVSAMSAHARYYLYNPTAIEHSIEYAQRLPPDFSVMLLKDYLNLAPDCRETLMRIPRFSRWAGEMGGLLNGSF